MTSWPPSVIRSMGIADLEPATRQLAELITRTREDDLSRPTPCPAYALGDLIEHVGGLALAFTAAARKDRGPRTGAQPSGRQPAARRLAHPHPPGPGRAGRGPGGSRNPGRA